MVCEQGEVAAQEVILKLFSGINNSKTLLLDCAILSLRFRQRSVAYAIALPLCSKTAPTPTELASVYSEKSSVFESN